MPRMARWVVIAIAAVAVGIAAYASIGNGGKGGGKTLQVPYAYSTNQEALLLPLIAEFNKAGVRSGVKRIEIVGQSIASGEAESSIAKRTLRPTIWSPASSLWGRLLNYDTDRVWAGSVNPPLMRTPLVIAVWRAEAEALGWPGKPIGFAQILELATSKTGWAQFGLPTYGEFKLGHTNPGFSTSGLSFVAAQYYTATGKHEGLTIADVRAPSARAKVRRIQQSIVHYGDTSKFFLDQLQKHGPGYISAVAMEEVTLLDYNRTRVKSSPPLVAIYPSEGTFDFDNPLITLHAPWVDAQQRRAATVFERWIVKRVTPRLAARYGYRPSDRQRAPAAPIDRAHLVDPTQPHIVLGLPEPRVLAAIKAAWLADRKPANVAVVVDTSGSMQDQNKLEQAQEGLRVFMRQFSPRDRVGLVTFADDVNPVVPLAPVAANRAELLNAVDHLVARGGTAVYDATARAVDLIAGLHDTTRINAVVVLTDGADTASNRSIGTLLARLKAQSESQEHNVRVFTIAYGSDANKDVLHSIADASGGLDYTGDPAEIAGVYKRISSFF